MATEAKIVFDGREISIREVSIREFEPRSYEITTDFPLPSVSAQFEWSFECVVKPSPKLKRLLKRQIPEPKREIERRARRHAKRPPTRGYWAKRCKCAVCLLARDRKVRLDASRYAVTFSEGKIPA